jgi:hypothetical protein
LLITGNTSANEGREARYPVHGLAEREVESLDT